MDLNRHFTYKFDTLFKIKKLMLQTPLDIGIRFIETLWFSFASRIVDRAINIYNVDEERAELLRQKFLKRGEFQVIVGD